MIQKEVELINFSIEDEGNLFELYQNDLTKMVATPAQ